MHNIYIDIFLLASTLTMSCLFMNLCFIIIERIIGGEK
jgi:hypothetical protein